jgi:hypothetical protein
MRLCDFRHGRDPSRYVGCERARLTSCRRPSCDVSYRGRSSGQFATSGLNLSYATKFGRQRFAALRWRRRICDAFAVPAQKSLLAAMPRRVHYASETRQYSVTRRSGAGCARASSSGRNLQLNLFDILFIFIADSRNLIGSLRLETARL